MIKFNVKQVGNYLDVVMVCESVTIDLGFLDEEKVNTLLQDYEEFIQDLRKYKGDISGR